MVVICLPNEHDRIMMVVFGKRAHEIGYKIVDGVTPPLLWATVGLVLAFEHGLAPMWHPAEPTRQGPNSARQAG